VSFIDYKIIAGILIFFTSLLAVSYPIKVRAKPTHSPLLEAGDAFASGIFLGTALFHMLPESVELFSSLETGIDYPFAELLCAFGFLILLFLERVSETISHSKKTSNMLPYMIAIILIIHSLIEGAVLGVNTSFETALFIFIAIIAHKSSESFALAVVLNPTNLSLKAVIAIVAIFSLMTPIGIMIGTSISEGLEMQSAKYLTAIFNAFASGTFLYMSTLHHINHHQKMHHAGENLLEFLYLAFGMGIMAVIAIWA